ncbi:fatty acid desaturase family protein, partial [Gandjariella thermophila]|uniref:fatty acid desaturase family protein n=1 Tax=Gandjariella thermophila TaxID=1931992 RepID=UPI001864A6CF
MQPAEPVARVRSDYAELLRRVKAAGLLDRRPAHFAIRTAVIGLLFVGGWVAFALLGPSWWQLVVAAGLAVVFAQVGFLGHDAGHRQVFRSRRANDVVGFLSGNLGIGLSFGWWVDKHNRHHERYSGRLDHLKVGQRPRSDKIVFLPQNTTYRRGRCVTSLLQ